MRGVDGHPVPQHVPWRVDLSIQVPSCPKGKQPERIGVEWGITYTRAFALQRFPGLDKGTSARPHHTKCRMYTR